MSPELLQLVNLLLVPVVGLLWRISTQLATVLAVQEAHDARLKILERLDHHGQT
jgi:hypothetical protein